MSTTIEDRVILVLRAADDGYGFWQRLEEQTGVVAQRWRKVFTSQQRPTPDILQALCRLKPEYAFWIATGITDAENGHKAPETALTFPERRSERASDRAALEYFQTSLALLGRLTANIDADSPAARLDAFGRVLLREQWQANPVVEAAARELYEAVEPLLKSLGETRRELQDVPLPKTACGRVVDNLWPRLKRISRSRQSPPGRLGSAPPPESK